MNGIGKDTKFCFNNNDKNCFRGILDSYDDKTKSQLLQPFLSIDFKENEIDDCLGNLADQNLLSELNFDFTIRIFDFIFYLRPLSQFDYSLIDAFFEVVPHLILQFSFQSKIQVFSITVHIFLQLENQKKCDLFQIHHNFFEVLLDIEELSGLSLSDLIPKQIN